MDIDGIITDADKYARDYAGYLLAVVKYHSRGGHTKFVSLDDKKNKLFVNALVSMVIGIFLNQKFVSGKYLTEINFISAMTSELCYWIFLAIFLHVVLNGPRPRGSLVPALSVVLRVLPVALVIGAYFGFLAFGLSLGFIPVKYLEPHLAAAITAVLAQTVATVIFLPAMLADMPLTPQHASEHAERPRFASKTRIGVAVTLVAVVSLVTSVSLLTGGKVANKVQADFGVSGNDGHTTQAKPGGNR